jgi:hypothetical protein
MSWTSPEYGSARCCPAFSASSQPDPAGFFGVVLAPVFRRGVTFIRHADRVVLAPVARSVCSYRVYSNMGPAAFRRLPKGGFVHARRGRRATLAATVVHGPRWLQRRTSTPLNSVDSVRRPGGPRGPAAWPRLAGRRCTWRRPPDDDRSGEQLDHRVLAETDQGDRGGDQPGGDRDGGLGDHPSHGGVLEPKAPPEKTVHVGRGNAHRQLLFKIPLTPNY